MFIKSIKTFFIAMFTALFTTICIAQSTDSGITASNFSEQSQAAQQTNTFRPLIVPTPPSLSVKAYVLMDVNSGKILAQKNMDVKHAPASLTKLMTLYLTSRAIKAGSISLNDKVMVSKKAWKMGGSKMFIKVGDNVPVNKLIQGIIVDSGNDACVALSEYIGGSESSFVNMMNAEAASLGMKNTNYIDCTGMPRNQHYSTAYDLALLARAIIKDYPKNYHWYKQKWFTYNGIRQPNRNRLLWRYPLSDGLKTGHTSQAGYCLVSSAKHNGMRLISVVLGARTDEGRANSSIRLLNYGFRFFESHLLYQTGSIITKIRVWYGNNKNVNASVKNDIYAVIPKGEYQNVKVKVVIPHNLKAPIKKDQKIGKIIVLLDGKEIKTTPLIALSNNKKGGLWRHSYDWIAHFFE